MKTCNTCKEEKPLTEFNKSVSSKDGLRPWCRRCQSIWKNAYYKDNTERLLEKQRNYRLENPEKIILMNSNYRANNPNKIKAHHLIERAIKRMTIKQEHCPCGSPNKTEGHHDDYAFPFIVRWLCRRCHQQWHTEHGPGLNG